MERTLIGKLSSHIGETVTIKGWVSIRRDQGKMIFLDFRDASGTVQGVILPNAESAMEVGKKLRTEFVVAVEGKVNERPERNKKADVQNGDIELEILTRAINTHDRHLDRAPRLDHWRQTVKHNLTRLSAFLGPSPEGHGTTFLRLFAAQLDLAAIASNFMPFDGSIRDLALLASDGDGPGHDCFVPAGLQVAEHDFITGGQPHHFACGQVIHELDVGRSAGDLLDKRNRRRWLGEGARYHAVNYDQTDQGSRWHGGLRREARSQDSRKNTAVQFVHSSDRSLSIADCLRPFES